MTAYFQLRTIAMHMDADPDTVDPRKLSLTLSTYNPLHPKQNAREHDPHGDSIGGCDHFHRSTNSWGGQRDHA